MKFRTKQVIKEAIQWTGKNLSEISDFAGESLMPIERRPDYDLKIKTLEGVMTADRFDWIIKGIKGEIYPCKPEIFEATYEAVIEPPSAEKYFGGFTGQEDGLE